MPGTQNTEGTEAMNLTQRIAAAMQDHFDTLEFLLARTGSLGGREIAALYLAREAETN